MRHEAVRQSFRSPRSDCVTRPLLWLSCLFIVRGLLSESVMCPRWPPCGPLVCAGNLTQALLRVSRPPVAMLELSVPLLSSYKLALPFRARKDLSEEGHVVQKVRCTQLFFFFFVCLFSAGRYLVKNTNVLWSELLQ